LDYSLINAKQITIESKNYNKKALGSEDNNIFLNDYNFSILDASEIHSVLVVKVIRILLWMRISNILVNLVFKLRVVLPFWGIFVDHRHVWVDYDLSVLLNGSDLAV